jgi:hypothetical protein
MIVGMGEANERAVPQHASEALRQRMPALSRVFVSECAGGFTAHCAEFDIVGEGDTEQEAIESTFALLRAYVLSALELDEVERLVPPIAPRPEPVAFTASAAFRRIRRQLSMPVGTREVEDILSRFGARKMRETAETIWERPRAGGGTYCIAVPRNRARLARRTLNAIIGLSGISEDDWWTAAEDPSFPSPIRRCRDALGFTNAEMAPMLDVPELSLELMCSGKTAPGRDAASALAELNRLRAGVASWHAPRGRVWKLVRQPHPACGDARPVDVLQGRRDSAELGVLVDHLIRREQAFVVDRRWNDRRSDREQRVA